MEDERWSCSVDGGSGGAEETAERAAVTAWERGASSQEEIARAVGSSLVRDGWGEGIVEARLDTLDGGVDCRILLSGLARARIDSLFWEGESTANLRLPDRVRTEAFDETMFGIVQKQREEGYLLASIQVVAVEGSGAAVRLGARFEPERRFFLAGPLFRGVGSTSHSYLERVAGLRRGDPVRPGELERARLRLERTGLFQAVDPPALRPVNDDLLTAVFDLRPVAHNRIDGAIGYDGKRRTLSGLLSLALGNLFGTGRRAAASWERLDADRSSLDLSYREPYLAGLPVAGEFYLAQQVEDTTWTADRAQILLEAELPGGIRTRAGVIETRTIDSGPSPAKARQTATLLGLGYDNRSDAGTRGVRLDGVIRRGRLTRSPSFDSGEGILTTLNGLAEVGRPLRGGWHARAAAGGGWIEGPDSLPRPESFSIGGSGSLRGHAEGSFRALRYATASLELGWRQLPEGNRVYLFRDQGVIRPWPAGKDRWEGASGAGARVRGASGWVVLEYGVPDGTGPLDGRIHFRLETRF